MSRRRVGFDAEIPVAVASELNLGIALTKPSVTQKCVDAEIPFFFCVSAYEDTLTCAYADAEVC